MTADALYAELVATLGSAREARWVLEEVDGAPDAARATEARALASRRAGGEPLQYVLGHWPFRELDLLTEPGALIPRPETELLVGLALDRVLEREGRPVVCDLGCGTGAIALSVACEAAAHGRPVEVHATDVSPRALSLAARNAARVGTSGVRFHLGSWYEALPGSLRGRVDACCANPPYVAAEDRPGLDRELDFEPEVALVAADGSDGTPGFAAIEAVVAGATRWLAPRGTLLVEHGEAQGDAAVAHARAAGLEVVADHLDLSGRPRVLEARAQR